MYLIGSLLLVTVRINPLKAKVVEGYLSTHENWAFLTRFCFLSKEGKFEYLIEYDMDYAVQNLLLYYDTYDQWTSAYYPGLSCEQRESLAKMSRKQIVNLTSAVAASGCVAEPAPMLSGVGGGPPPPGLLPRRGRRLRCREARRFSSARQRWWFIAVSNCNSTKGLRLMYKFRMTNGPPGDFWHEHFSADEFFILPILIAFWVLYVMLLLASIFSAVEMKQRHLLHSTYKLFMVSETLHLGGIILQCVAYMKYALDGVEASFFLTTGRLNEAAGEAAFLLLLLLLAKGFTVTRGRLRLASGIKITVFMCLYVITYCAIFIYERLFFDPGQVLYLYESPAGYALVLLRGAAWGMFLYGIIFTLQHYPEKSNFYYPFNLLGTLWFVAGPACILAAYVFVDNWVRESVVCGAHHVIAFCGHSLFLFMTLPSRRNNFFPYHVRTTQVDVMRMAHPDSTLPFSRRAYAPSTAAEAAAAAAAAAAPRRPPEWVGDTPVELFTVASAVAGAGSRKGP